MRFNAAEKENVMNWKGRANMHDQGVASMRLTGVEESSWINHHLSEEMDLASAVVTGTGSE